MSLRITLKTLVTWNQLPGTVSPSKRLTIRTPIQITQALLRAVARQPGALATILGGSRHVFVQFQDCVSRQAGDRFGIQSLNSDCNVEFFMAVPSAGAAVNPMRRPLRP
jgi:hypothetical protein